MAKPGLRELGVLWDYSPPAFPDGLVAMPEPFMSSRPDGPLGRSVAEFAKKVDEQLTKEAPAAARA